MTRRVQGHVFWNIATYRRSVRAAESLLCNSQTISDSSFNFSFSKEDFLADDPNHDPGFVRLLSTEFRYFLMKDEHCSKVDRQES